MTDIEAGGGSRAARVDGDLPVVILHEGEELRCRAVNLSRSGLLLTGRAAWPSATELRLIVSSPGGDLHATATVRRVRLEPSPGGGPPDLAVEFLNLDPLEHEGLEFLLQRLLEGQGSAPGGIPHVPRGAPPHEATRLLDAVPLAHRIAVAARASAPEREALFHDRHPPVIDALAHNPMLTVAEARLLASSPHISPVGLARLAGEARWTADEEVRIRIVANAHVPLAVAERLIDTLSLPAKRRALHAPGLQPAVRAALLHRLSR